MYRHAYLKYKNQQQKSWFEKNFYAQHLSFSTKNVNKSKATTTFLCDLSILEKNSTHITKIKLVFKKVGIWKMKIFLITTFSPYSSLAFLGFFRPSFSLFQPISSNFQPSNARQIGVLKSISPLQYICPSPPTHISKF